MRRENVVAPALRGIAIGLLAVVMSAVSAPAWGEETQVAFDLPDAIECRDVTPADFTQAHPQLKVIEAKFRISARVDQGNVGDVVDFLYTISSADRTMRVHDYLPNTTLESSVAEDQIEVTDGAENASTLGGEAHVAYKVFNASAVANHASKVTHSSHYKQLAAKELVVASGTTDREHGVFFRLRPSRLASLEGAKEFTFLAVVPKSWRGDVCVIVCQARANKAAMFSKTIEPAGEARVRVGMFLTGDAEAATLADAYRRAQERYAAATRRLPPKENVFDTISHQTVGFFTSKKPDQAAQRTVQESAAAVVAAQAKLKDLSR